MDLGINYLMINTSMGIYSDQYPALRGITLALKDITHTLTNPVAYYQEKYPNIQCFTY